jgi:DNA-binding HxlR family transcriptional regulator
MRFDRSVAVGDCTLAAALDVLGEKWTLLVVREAFYGVRRFEDFHRQVGCARNVLSARLAKLVDHEVLERRRYREPGQRGRDEYQLTDRGSELLPVLVALMRWGSRLPAVPDGPVYRLRHRDCGADLVVELVCSEGHGGLSARHAEPVPVLI